MKQISILAATTLLASPVWADLTPTQVWEDFQSALNYTSDATVTHGALTTDGDTLVVPDIRYTVRTEQKQEMFGTSMTTTTDLQMDLGTLRFEPLGDGTVKWAYPAKVDGTVASSSQIEGGEAVNQTFQFEVEDQNTVVTSAGTPGDVTHSFVGDSTLIRVPAIPDDDGNTVGSLAMTLSDYSGSYRVTGDALLNIAQDMRIGAIQFDMDLSDDGDVAKIDGTMKDVAAVGEVAMPRGMSSSDPAQAYRDGLATRITYSTSGSSWVVDAETDDGPFKGEYTSEGSTGDMAVSAKGMRLASMGTGMTVVVRPAGMPLAFEGRASALGMELDLPMAASETAAPLGLDVTVTDLQVSDMLWGMMDPTGQLPRDPVSLRIDLDGMARLNRDLFDPEQMMQLSAPGEIDSLNLKTLSLSLLGASLNGEGALTFDNEDKETFGGAPVPVGQVTLQGQGINGLLDKLVAMGLVPQDQVMMGRMMMGMFAKQTGDDELSSTVEFQPGGAILANGQRIR